MELRSTALVAALLSLSLDGFAQNESPAVPATPVEPVAGTQDPDRPSKTPAQRVAELEQERKRLQKEIEFVRERVAKSKQMLGGKFSDRKLNMRSIDAGTNSVAPAMSAPQKKPATLLSDDQKKALGSDAMLLIEGRPIREAEFNTRKTYLEAAGSAPTEDVRNQRAMLELLRIEAAIGSYPQAAAEANKQMLDAQQEIQDGKEFVEVAKKYSRGPLVQDAKMTVTRNCPYGLLIEKAAFETPEGKATGIIRGLNGYAMIHVDKQNKDDDPRRCSVEGRMILIPYHPDPGELQQIQSRVALGQVNLQLRDKDVINSLPVMMRPSQVIDSTKNPKKDTEFGPKKMAPSKDAPMKSPKKSEQR